MGQLGLRPQPEIALPLIHQAATVDSVQAPQPAGIFSGNSPMRRFPRNSLRRTRRSRKKHVFI